MLGGGIRAARLVVRDSVYEFHLFINRNPFIEPMQNPLIVMQVAWYAAQKPPDAYTNVRPKMQTNAHNAIAHLNPFIIGFPLRLVWPRRYGFPI